MQLCTYAFYTAILTSSLAVKTVSQPFPGIKGAMRDVSWTVLTFRGSSVFSQLMVNNCRENYLVYIRLVEIV